ncbi:septum formation initiator family protein [Paenibacillus spiritus]|uniref:Septum formation initiator family protein n=1 Tax=Paenibacillus spiritus TaxID=2496557 RepID=A0A5J5G843_9BACL|nr:MULTISPECIES: septum formation initiator family protein [Paenibacillus]KAA9003605.1 septum formation initiator family protein [Paenibacillus spiritus]
MNRFATTEETVSSSRPPAKTAGVRRRKIMWMTTVVLFFAWAGYIFVAQSAAISDKSGALARKQEAKAGADQSLNQLKYEVSRLGDNEYIGELARKRYNMYKPGEVPIRVEDNGQ